MLLARSNLVVWPFGSGGWKGQIVCVCGLGSSFVGVCTNLKTAVKTETSLLDTDITTNKLLILYNP